MITYVNQIIRKSVSVLSAIPPCPFVVVAIGSLARGEATPYSDLEYMFLIKRTTPAMEAYFERLAITTYFLIGNLRETKLSGMAIEELEGWFDDCGKNGFKIDGLHKKAGNIPTGNGFHGFKNKFILTPEELLEEYKQCFTYPLQEQAIQGDMTAMFRYMKEVFSYNMPGDLLHALLEKISQVQPSEERVENNEKMLKSDIAKFDFKPSSDLENKGYTLNIKKDIFRFPSILLVDLAIVHNTSCSMSWDVPSNMQQSGCLSENMAEVFCFILASACYVRLEAYLHHDAHDDRVSVAKHTVIGNGSGKSSFPYRRYFMNEVLYFTICTYIIPLKNDLCSRGINEVLKSDTYQSMDAWSNKIEIFRSCGRFSMALGILQEALHLGSTCIGDGNVINTLKKHCNLSTMKVVADILLRSAAFQAALPVYEYLLEEAHDGFFNLRMAECLRKLGKLQESLETLQVTTTASADKHYQMGMVFLSLDGQQTLALVNLTKALFEYHNCKSGKDQPFEVFMKLPRVEMLAVITSANPKTANCLMALGDLYRQRGDHANARAYLKKAFEILAESYVDEAVVPAIGHYLQHSGVAYSDCDDHARAKDYFIH